MSRIVAAVFLLLSISGCVDQTIRPTSPSSPNEPPITYEEAVSHLSALGFRVSDMKETTDQFVVEGDIAFDKKVLSRWGLAAPQHEADIKQATTQFILQRPVVGDIRIYVDASIPYSGSDAWRNEIAVAAANWTNLPGSAVTMSITNTPMDADITIIAGALDDNELGESHFPSSIDAAGTPITINLTYNDNQTLTSSQKIFLVTHELGHCIAFRHTNWSPRDESDDTPWEANEIRHGCPSTDPSSIMNGGTAGYNWSAFSQYDVLAAELIYPQWADYTQLGGAVWTDTNAMTSLGQSLYLVENSRLYRVDPGSGGYTQLGGAVWANTNAMTSLNGYLYIVQNNRLERVDPSNGSWITLGNAVWANTEAMTTLNGWLYLVENSRLYRVSSIDGAYTQIGAAVWTGTYGMTALGAYLYIVENSRLYRVNPTTGSYTQLGNAVWVYANGIIANGGYLYIVQNDLYYKVSSTDGAYTRLGGIAWTDTYAMTSLGAQNYIAENSRLYRVGLGL